MITLCLVWSALAATLVLPEPPTKETPAESLTDVLLVPSGEYEYVLDRPLIRYRVSANVARLDGWSDALGLSLAEVDEPLQVHLGLKPQEGLLVTAVDDKGPARKASILVNDVILGLPDKVEKKRPLEVTAIRAGQRRAVTLALAAAKQYWIGVHTADLDDAMRTQLSLPTGRGILISEVIDKSPAQQAGLLKHDVVTGLANGTAIGTTEEFSKTVQGSGGKALQLQIVRHAKSMTIGITPVERPAEPEQQPQAANVARTLTWLAQREQQSLGTYVQLQPQLTLQPQGAGHYVQWRAVQALQGAAKKPDAASKVAALEKQIEQLLKEVKSLRKTLEQAKQPEVKQPKK